MVLHVYKELISKPNDIRNHTPILEYRSGPHIPVLSLFWYILWLISISFTSDLYNSTYVLTGYEPCTLNDLPSTWSWHRLNKNHLTKSIHHASSYHKNLGSNPSHSPLDPAWLLGQSRITSSHWSFNLCKWYQRGIQFLWYRNILQTTSICHLSSRVWRIENCPWVLVAQSILYRRQLCTI